MKNSTGIYHFPITPLGPSEKCFPLYKSNKCQPEVHLPRRDGSSRSICSLEEILFLWNQYLLSSVSPIWRRKKSCWKMRRIYETAKFKTLNWKSRFIFPHVACMFRKIYYVIFFALRFGCNIARKIIITQFPIVCSAEWECFRKIIEGYRANPSINSWWGTRLLCCA